MSTIKKAIKYILFISILCFLLIPFINNNKVNATEINNNEVSVKNFQSVDSIGYLYNFDGSPDYIYIDFMGKNGYVIFSEETLEILEYTNNGSFPYESINEQKYYGGPYKYFVKIDENFKNILTNEEISFSSDYIEQISSFSRLKFNTKKKTNLKVDDLTAKEKVISKYDINLSNYELTNSALSPQSPPLDEDNWIYPTGDATYIDNVEYFMTPYQTPRHGENNGESCTTVAIQLLLSYNNYYNDRRIIAPEYLFGNWKAGSTDIFDRNSYEIPDYNPNVCSNPNRITSEIIGSNQAFHDYLFSKDVTGFLKDAQTGLKKYLNNRGIDYNIECEMETTLPFDWGFVKTIDPTKITSKIDEGKPVVISTAQNLNGTPYTTSTGDQRAFNHSVIAYGYQTLAPYTSSGNSNSYLGYIVHMGWDEYGYGHDTNIWTNSSWYYSYLSIDINHNHNYNIVINNIIDDQKIEKRCSECGHRTLDDLFVISGNTITDVRYDLIGDITIPREINGIEVKGIGQGAFKDCRNLRKITFPNTIINLDSSAFENCTSLENVILSNKLTSIGNSAFKGCASLESISIPNSVTHLDTSAFEGCSYLQSVRLPNSLIAIGSSAFKGCASLARITIPNTVTNIDTSAFEGCSYLQSVTLSTNLIAIGSSAFKGCGSLERIVIPLSVQYIDDEAFKNCSSLSVVTVNRRITNITNLGVSVFDGCNASLKIIVPANRIAEYKNKEYWSSYRNKIMPSEDYTEYEIDCEGNVTESLSLSKATNELYKLNVNCSKSYKINANSSKTINIIIYDANMNVISSGSNTVTQFLGCGTYYISFEFDDTNASGTFEIGISLTWTSSNILLSKGTNNIKNSMHLNNENVYHCSYKYLNNQGEGFYRFSLNVGSNIILPEGTIKIYSNINKTELLNRYGLTGINEQAITYNGENELYVFLPENGYYYIDVVLPKSTYSLITLTIEQVEKNDINYQNRLATIGFDELFDNKTLTNYFEEVTISHRSKIELDIVTSGTINRNIPIYIFEKHRDPGYEPGDNHYYLVLEYTNNITSINRSPVFTVNNVIANWIVTGLYSGAKFGLKQLISYGINQIW